MFERMSRRSFFRAASAAGAGVAMHSLFPGSAFAADRDYAGLPVGIQSYSLRGFQDFDVLVEKIKGLGLHFAEFYSAHLPMNLKPEELKARLEKLKAAGIQPTAYGVQRFDKNHDANRKQFEFAKACGMKNLTADTPNPKKDPEGLKATMDSLDKLVEEYGINIAIHNHGPGSNYQKPQDVLDAVKDHHKRIGACADLGHYIRSDVDPVEALTALKDRLFGIHLKDFKKTAPGKFQGCILGQGVMKPAAVMKFLKDAKFDGAISLEYEENPKNPIADIEACLDASAAGAKA